MRCSTKIKTDFSYNEASGTEIYDIAERIFPICRSITGDGVRKTLSILADYLYKDGIELKFHEVPTGTQVFDWLVPKEWVIRSAYIEDEQGNIVINMMDNNLHVMGYSAPIDKWVNKDELHEYVYTQPEQPDVIPYVTSYYKERSGFCMSQKQFNSLKNGKYHLFIDSELKCGSLTYADVIFPGKTERELMFSSYICHPSMANNECSGPAVLVALMKYVNRMKNRKYTYRFVLNPETIGALVYIHENLLELKKNLDAGIILTCVGDDRDYSLVETRYGNTLADKSVKAILRGKSHFSLYSYLERGSDERQYNAPGIDLPVVSFSRTKPRVYPEYHTSADDMNLISPAGLNGSFLAMVEWIQAMEHNERYHINVLGEPQLGKRGLYPTISQKGKLNESKIIFDLIAYADGKNDIFDICERIGVVPQDIIVIIDKLVENGLL